MSVFQRVLGDSGIIVHGPQQTSTSTAVNLLNHAHGTAHIFPAGVPTLCQDVSRATRKLSLELKMLDSLQLDSFRSELYRRIQSPHELKWVSEKK